MQYTGYKYMELSDSDLVQLYAGNYHSNEFKENEYLIVTKNNEPIDYFCYQCGNFRQVKFPVLGNDQIGKIKPKNAEQYCAFDLLKDRNIPIKLITGCFGSGKSLACITASLEAVYRGEFDKIVFIRNNVQVKDTDQLGALPGSEFEKSLPYLMPFADHCGGIEGLQELIAREQLEVIPLAFLRGRSIKNAILYSMESENLTKSHIQLIMGRVDEGSQLWMDGDIKQRDKVAFDNSKGLETMIERLSGIGLFGYVHLTKSERSEVAALADRLD